jgi:hypothetical protein
MYVQHASFRRTVARDVVEAVFGIAYNSAATSELDDCLWQPTGCPNVGGYDCLHRSSSASSSSHQEQ